MKSLFVSFPFSDGLGTSVLLSCVKNLHVAILVMDEHDSPTPNEDC